MLYFTRHLSKDIYICVGGNFKTCRGGNKSLTIDDSMQEDYKAIDFLSQYDQQVLSNALKLREVLFDNLPDITEQLDIPAKMVAYCYGQKYPELICTIIPSKKGLKLGFYRGADLPDPDNLLEGAGKISRYIVIKSDTQIKSSPLQKLLVSA